MGISVERHNKERCNRRLISCINREFGCKAEVPLNELHNHLRLECRHEIKKNEKVFTIVIIVLILVLIYDIYDRLT